MIKDALRYIVGLGEAHEYAINGDTYSDKELYRIDPYIPRADPIKMHTLTSLVDYIKAEVDDMAERMIVEVRSPEEVALYSQLDSMRVREILAVVRARVPEFPFDKFLDQERFCINLQSKFIDDTATDRALLLKFAGTVEAGTVAEYGDDGVTQKATVKTGIASKGDAIVPNPVKLRPYRTFLEVEQPVSEFIFRMKQDKYDGINCAIFEADGGAWQMAATRAIKEHLEFELSGFPQFTIIS
ncbi:Uncharacterised protein [uncultured Clostridium sp.]|nr:Uncharacterised protein [uncultured Clostridium sp.]